MFSSYFGPPSRKLRMRASSFFDGAVIPELLQVNPISQKRPAGNSATLKHPIPEPRPGKALLFFRVQEQGMKRGDAYTLRAATLGILSMEDSDRPVMIPSGATITVIDGNINGNRFVDIDWQGQTLTVFVVDLRARGIKAIAKGVA
jgi:hypothetical protein